MVWVLSFFKTIFKGINQFFGFFSLKRLGFLQAILLLLVIACSIYIGYPSETFATQSNKNGIVTANKLNMRSKPGKRFTSLKSLKKGTKIKILEKVNGWLKIEYKGQIGYIINKKQYVQIIREPDIKESKRSDLDKKNKDRDEEAEDISRKIEHHKSEVRAFSKKEASVINELNEIDLALNIAKKHVAAIKSDLSELDDAARKTEIASKKLLEMIQTSEIYTSKRLVALYKLSWLGSMSYLFSAESMYELSLRRKAFKQILAYDKRTLETLENNNNSLHTLLKRLNTQKKEKLNLEENYNKQIRVMSQEEKKRSKILADIRNKKSLEMALIESLKEAANSLNHTIKSSSINLNQSKQVKKKLANNFADYKGLLKMPVQGKIATHFGQYKNKKLNITSFRNGINIKTDRGEPIHAVSAGTILYSDWFKGYGNMVIIDHGNNYYTVYANAEEIFKEKGNTVEIGEVIATVGDTGSITGPGLYFEVRHHGKSINPLLWIKKG